MPERKSQDMSGTATSSRSAHYIESRLKHVKPAAGWGIEWTCAQTLATQSVEGAEPPSPPTITRVSPSAAFAAATTSRRTERAKRVSRLLSSSGNAGGKESTRDDKNEDEAASVEVLQADPNEATVRDQGRQQGAPMVAGAAAPDRNHGCVAAAAAGRGAPAQRWRRAATAAGRRWGEGRPPGGAVRGGGASSRTARRRHGDSVRGHGDGLENMDQQPKRWAGPVGLPNRSIRSSPPSTLPPPPLRLQLRKVQKLRSLKRSLQSRTLRY